MLQLGAQCRSALSRAGFNVPPREYDEELEKKASQETRSAPSESIAVGMQSLQQKSLQTTIQLASALSATRGELREGSVCHYIEAETITIPVRPMASLLAAQRLPGQIKLMAPTDMIPLIENPLPKISVLMINKAQLTGPAFKWWLVLHQWLDQPDQHSQSLVLTTR